jgi:sulfite exporter TauE/SafE
MWYVAFTLGLFGSLHCVGMCGPLALVFSNKEGNSKYQNVISALAYNLGRTFMYSLLGLFFGAIGSFLFVADLQKAISIILGILLIFSFLFTIDIDHTISNHRLLHGFYSRIRSLMANMMQKSQEFHPFQLGMANGLLPCGLVYLALAGSLASGNMIGGVEFMFLFGLGTLPMLFALTTGIGFFPPSARMSFRKVLPYVTLAFGCFLIYRGVDLPAELNFWEALKNPVMCH